MSRDAFVPRKSWLFGLLALCILKLLNFIYLPSPSWELISEFDSDVPSTSPSKTPSTSPTKSPSDVAIQSPSKPPTKFLSGSPHNPHPNWAPHPRNGWNDFAWPERMHRII
eukprot:713226_1